jgi:hypothetical protein
MLPRATTPKPRSITLPQATQLQLRRPSITQPRLTTHRLLLRTTLNRNTTPRLQFTTPQPTLHLATTPRPLSTTLPMHLSIIPLLTLLRPATPKLRTITLSRVTTPLRYLNVTPRPTLLQLTTETFLNTRIEFSIFNHVQICRFLIVTSHWELLIFNEKINFINLGNHFEWLLLPPKSLLTLRRFLNFVGSLLFRILEMTIALVTLPSDVFWCLAKLHLEGNLRKRYTVVLNKKFW